jgi:hypothetical protein
MELLRSGSKSRPVSQIDGPNKWAKGRASASEHMSGSMDWDALYGAWLTGVPGTPTSAEREHVRRCVPSHRKTRSGCQSSR